MLRGVYDLTAPLCVTSSGGISTPLSGLWRGRLVSVGHELVVDGKVIRYLSNYLEADLTLGTHLDLPTLLGYEFNFTKLPITYFIREALIVNVGTGKVLKRKVLLEDITELIDESRFKGVPRDRRPALIIRTGYSRLWCSDPKEYLKFNGLDIELSKYLANELQPPILGIDAASVDPIPQPSKVRTHEGVGNDFLVGSEYTYLENHDQLLRKGVLILENLYLNEVPNYVSRALMMAIPVIKLSDLNLREGIKLHTVPCATILITPPPNHEVIIKELDELEDILEAMVGGIQE